ncbi:hypothetical protein [Collinsella aerofaciens]|uniref:hypothetical protein n=1 Tax=Collinsella aerofaciens TaxID=74426 RepID=UPI0012605BE7|nr:hypothetical protein [Collinsella aerofaciens]VWL63480.1 Uncharacterised protein [Collinsella aerofaciens]
METTARGDKPKTLQTIAYISIPDSADLEFLLWDLQDAIAAYAQLSGTVLPRPVDLKANDTGVVDGMVLAVDDAFDDEAMSVVGQALDCLGGTETRVYVVVRAAYERSEGARMLIKRLRQACELRRLTWCGGVIAYTGSGIAALRHSPRMGLLRRPFSEAMDKLVGAVRMGCSVEHAQLLGGGDISDFDPDGIITAKQAIPAWLWRLATRHCG